MSEETAPYGSGAQKAPEHRQRPAAPLKRVRTQHLREMKQRGERFTMLTAYDMYTAEIFDEAGIEVLLVGDSASNNVYGNETSLPVTVDELIPLTRAVSRSVKRSLVVGDLPFGSYQRSPEQAYDTAVRFMKEGGAHAVKLEGGREMVPQIELLSRGGVPVMAHIGFTPQSEHALGGYRVQGRGDTSQRILDDARAVEAAGAFAVVMEMVPGRRRRAGDQGADHPDDRHRRPASTATPRCWSGRTRSACAVAGWPASSSSTPTCAAYSSTGRRPTRDEVRSGAFPGSRAHLLRRGCRTLGQDSLPVLPDFSHFSP